MRLYVFTNWIHKSYNDFADKMTNEIRILLTFFVAFFATLFVMPNMSHIANRIGLVDRPNERKMHKVPKPLVGGIGIVISATFSSLLFVPLEGLRGFFSGLALLLLVGFFDDFLEIGHRKKFLAQIIATTLLMYFSKVQLADFGNLVGLGNIVVPEISWVIWIVTIFSVVGVTNALNMIDGLDGLAGGVSFVAFLSFAILASLSGNTTLMLLNLAFTGAVLGFLRYNWTPSILFMGDAGSLCLGFALSFMALSLTQTAGATVSPVVVLIVLAVPIADTLTVMIKRIVAGKSPFLADRTHLHHTLIFAGIDARNAVGIMIILCLLFCVIGVFAVVFQMPDPLLFSVFLCYFLLNFFSTRIVIKCVDFLEMFKRQEKPHNCPKILHSFIKKINKSRLFRGAIRYPVDFDVTCSNYSFDKALSGNVVNISKTGFLANINGLGLICKECVVSIVFPEETGVDLLEFPVEHLWMSEVDTKQFHGFRFVNLDEKQRSILHTLLDQICAGEQ